MSSEYVTKAAGVAFDKVGDVEPLTTMIERVAEAVCDLPGNPSSIDIARAALFSMREPTEAMLLAAQEEWMCVRAAEERAGAIWRTMIDTAMKDIE